MLEIFVIAIGLSMDAFALCFLGAEFGKRIGNVFGEWSEIAGGIVLAGIGIKILMEHLADGT